MEVKNLFDPKEKNEIIERFDKLTPQTQHLWGKMDVAQMLAHCQKQVGVAIGTHKLSPGFIGKLLGPLVKKGLYNDKPFKRNLPTDKSFIMTGAKDFEKEKTALINLINQFTDQNIIDGPHPFFGKLTKEQWSKATWKHLDHHLQQFGA